MDDQAIAFADADQRTGNAAVVRPRVDADAGRDVHVRDARVEIDFDNVWIGIAIDGLDELEIFVPATGPALPPSRIMMLETVLRSM